MQMDKNHTGSPIGASDLAQVDLVRADLGHIWHPCTQMQDHESLPLIPIKSGKGVYLYDFDGKGYIDGISSWWVNLFGHCNPYISQKLKEQIESLEHVLLAGFSHEPIIRLSKRLVDLLPSPLQKCFYADNGSSAIEVALKMSYHKSLLQAGAKGGAKAGQKGGKRKFLALSNGYHGETIGALSVGGVELYKDTYGALLLECVQAPVPRGVDFAQELEIFKDLVRAHHHEICAFILEPLVQCAGGMHMYSAEFVREAVLFARSYGIDIIFDEIAVGFGRTGSMFALEQCGVVPDFLCLSKGITGGYLPLSVVVTTDEVYQHFYAPYESGKAFLHSHSYTGNPLACACANAVLDIFESDSILARNKRTESYIAAKMGNLASFPQVANIRHKGMIFAFDLVGTKKPRAGLEFFKMALARGVILRPLGGTIYFMPPFVITHEEIDRVVGCMEEILACKNF